MNFKKVANREHEDTAAWTTRSFSRHGLGKHWSRTKRRINRWAKRLVARADMKELCNEDQI